MESLSKQPNLMVLLETSIKKRRLTKITNFESQMIIREIANICQINPAISNFFTLSRPLTPQDYVNHVMEKVNKYYNPSAIKKQSNLKNVVKKSELEKVEDNLFSDKIEEVPIHPPSSRNINTLLSQIDQWTKNNSKSIKQEILPGGKEALISSIEKCSLSDAEDALEKETKKRRSDSDDDYDSDDDVVGVAKMVKDSKKLPEPPKNEQPVDMCRRLLKDSGKRDLSKYCEDLYDRINSHKESAISIVRTQPFIDELIEKGFDKVKVQNVLRQLINPGGEFFSIKDLNYTNFCYFVRLILQKYIE